MPVGLIDTHRTAHHDQAARALHARRHRLAVVNAHVLPGERGTFERVSYAAEILDRGMLQNINLRHRPKRLFNFSLFTLSLFHFSLFHSSTRPKQIAKASRRGGRGRDAYRRAGSRRGRAKSAPGRSEEHTSE